MKNFIAVLLCFAVVFSFAACGKKTTGGETTAVAGVATEPVAESATEPVAESATEPTTLPVNVVTDANGNAVTKTDFRFATDAKGQPVTDKNGAQLTTSISEYVTHPAGGIVTNANGDVVTEKDFGFILDEKGEPETDKDGKNLTTYVYVPATYPTAPNGTLPTTVPANPVGNTNPSKNQKWITDEFMSKLPKLRDNVDEAISATTDKGHYANIRINQLSYEEFLSYIETCKKAGFTQSNTGTVIPEKSVAGEVYRYSSNANGLYVTLTYYTDEYPYRTCDFYITVVDYDMLKEGVR